jgi:hypothetical protein
MEGSRHHWGIQEVGKADGPEHSTTKQTRAKGEGDHMNCLYDGLLVYRRLGKRVYDLSQRCLLSTLPAALVFLAPGPSLIVRESFRKECP